MENSLMEHALSRKTSDKPRKAKKKTVRHMNITKAHNGGYMIKHIHDDPAMHPDEDHVVADNDGLQNHIEQHLGPGQGEEAMEAQMGGPGGAPQGE